MNLSNCPKCGEIFVKNAVREMCEKCFREEEKLFQKVYTFLKKRENRAATIETVVKANNVEAELLYKWIKRSEEHTSELQSRENLVCRLLLEKKKKLGHDGEGSMGDNQLKHRWHRDVYRQKAGETV